MIVSELILSILAIIFLMVFIITFGVPAIKGAQFAVTTPSKTRKFVSIMEKFKAGGGNIVDLGSGDGRLVIAAAGAGYIAYGYEINPFLVWYSRYKIKKAGLSNRASIFRKDLWKENLSGYDIIILFGVGHRMEKFATKLNHELRPGTIVLCNYFQLPSRKAIYEEDKIFVYRF